MPVPNSLRPEIRDYLRKLLTPDVKNRASFKEALVKFRYLSQTILKTDRDIHFNKATGDPKFSNNIFRKKVAFHQTRAVNHSLVADNHLLKEVTRNS